MVEIVPFNEIFYKSCYYSSLFSILRSYNLDITPLLLHDIFFYNCKSSGKELQIKVSCKELKSAKEIMCEMGFEITSKYDVEKVVNSIKEELDLGALVIVWVDCYYLSNRKDTYQKQHWPHTILFYDYFRENDYFKVIEHDKKETLTYRRRSLSAKDVQNSYDGFCKMFQSREYDQFYAIKRKEDAINRYNGMNGKEVYRKNIENNLDLLFQGIGTLRGLNDIFLEQVIEETLDNRFLKKIIEDLNRMLIDKKALSYLNSLIMEPENIWNVNYQIIQNKIRLFRDVLVKCLFSNRINKKEILGKACFHEMYQLEKECLVHLF